jgi:hypothetical protein
MLCSLYVPSVRSRSVNAGPRQHNIIIDGLPPPLLGLHRAELPICMRDALKNIYIHVLVPYQQLRRTSSLALLAPPDFCSALTLSQEKTEPQ